MLLVQLSSFFYWGKHGDKPESALRPPFCSWLTGWESLFHVLRESPPTVTASLRLIGDSQPHSSRVCTWVWAALFSYMTLCRVFVVSYLFCPLCLRALVMLFCTLSSLLMVHWAPSQVHNCLGVRWLRSFNEHFTSFCSVQARPSFSKYRTCESGTLQGWFFIPTTL